MFVKVNGYDDDDDDDDVKKEYNIYVRGNWGVCFVCVCVWRFVYDYSLCWGLTYIFFGSRYGGKGKR
jgi:hypothetical protein